MRARFPLPHPAIVCGGPQLDGVIKELEAGTTPQPEGPIWRTDLPRMVAIRLARATGAPDELIAEVAGKPLMDCIECSRAIFEGERVDSDGGCVAHYACVPALAEGSRQS